jgi:SAM-dependent methyltransferase
MSALRNRIETLCAATRTLGAIGAALQARAGGTALPPGLAEPVRALVPALPDGPPTAEEAAALRPLLGLIRLELLLGARLALGQVGEGWAPLDPVMLQAAGDVSTAFPALLETRLVPLLPGLAMRLAEPGAVFLDVGTGVGAMAVEMARRWPGLSILGLDRWSPALELARQHIRLSGLADRIELRAQAAQDLAEEGRFDLAWVPGAFIRPEELPAILATCRHALRPGGWLLLAYMDAGSPLASLYVACLGGAPLPDASRHLADAGLREVTLLSGPAGSPLRFAAGRA